jgi:hypothetical protein
MANPIAANKAELLAIANAVASEKMIDKAIVVEALEEAIQRAARARYGAENDIRAKLDTQTGDFACGALSKWLRWLKTISSRSISSRLKSCKRAGCW